MMGMEQDRKKKKNHLTDLIVWAQKQPEILALYLYGSQSEGWANALSDVDIGILVNPEISKSQLWRLEDQWLVPMARVR